MAEICPAAIIIFLNLTNITRLMAEGRGEIACLPALQSAWSVAAAESLWPTVPEGLHGGFPLRKQKYIY